MRLLVKVEGKDAMIVGYCPDDNGMPQAIIICDGALTYAPFRLVELGRLPKRLRKATRKARKAAKVFVPTDIDLGAKPH